MLGKLILGLLLLMAAGWAIITIEVAFNFKNILSYGIDCCNNKSSWGNRVPPEFEINGEPIYFETMNEFADYCYAIENHSYYSTNGCVLNGCRFKINELGVAKKHLSEVEE